MPTDAPVSPVFHVDGLTEVDGHASTRWDEYGSNRPPNGSYDPNQGHWRIPTDRGSYLNDGDPYFQHIQAAAQSQYGDPDIHYAETGPNGDKHRYLAFGNGQALPQDGTIVYRADSDYFKRNADGTVTRWIPDGKESGQGHLDGAPIHTEARQLPNGTWALFDPATNKQVTAQSATRPGDNPPPPPKPDDPKHKDPKGNPPLQSTPTTIPDGMVEPIYPPWASQSDPDVGNQLTGVVARLYNQFGSGTPASSSVPDFPFNTDTGTNSGIDNYDALRSKFKALEGEFTSTAKAFNQAVKSSKVTTEQGRKAVNDAIADFNTKTGSLSEGSWDGLLQAETNLIDSAKDAVQKAAGAAHDVPANPDPGPGTPAPSVPIPDPGPTAPTPDPGTDSGTGQSDIDKLLNKLGGGLPLSGLPGMGGLGNPLGGLGGMNPFGGGGQGISPLGGGSAAPAAARLPDPGSDLTKPAVTPLNPPAPAGVPTPTPAAAAGPSTDPSAGNGAGPTVVPAGNASGTGTTVSLPDGKTVDAPNPQAAKAATNAITGASPGGDPAQKAYSGVMDLPGDGKNPGAKIDPGDMQAGDVLKWQDKTMVAAGPGLVADPTHPGVVHQLQDVLKDGKGFQGIFRPTAVDPTLTAHSAPPPVVDIGDQHPAPAPASPPPPAAVPDHPAPPPASPAPSTIPLASPSPPPPAVDPGSTEHQAVPPAHPAAQPAPPSPFAPHTAPPATRSTKAERTADGTE